MLKRVLADGWFIQSSEKVSVFGEKISTEKYNTDEWYPVTVPGTVVAGLVENNIYLDPYYNKNISSIPGYKHGKDSLFSNHYKPDDSPFRQSWWYRNRFQVSKDWQGKKVYLEFKGINYAANIWLNGKRIAGQGEVQGTYRLYKFDISDNLYFFQDNVLAVEVFSPDVDDLAITFIDWCPVPPDDSMGIWQDVCLHLSEDIYMDNTYLRSEICDDHQTAELTVVTELYNDTLDEKKVKLIGEIDNFEFEKEVVMEPKMKKVVEISVDDCPELKIENPRLWWPYQMGSPEMYNLKLKVFQDDILSDQQEVSFGIREINSYLNEKGSRVFVVNGEEIQLRGAAWAPDLMLRQSEIQDQIDINYLKNMNFNTVRLEGKLATDNFWDLCDKEGIIVIAGWPCCNHWERWFKWKAEDLRVAVESMTSQVKRLRSHPSLIAWFYGSDFPPPYEVEREYLQVMKDCCPDIPAVSSAADKPAKLTGEPGVKMSGPYSYIPPQYWYDESMPGVAGKFNTETGPDMCLPQFDSLKRFLEPEELEVGSDAWKLHAGLADFTDTRVLERVIEGRFGKDLNIEEYLKAAQLIGYQSWRAMYEAHFRNWPDATGVIGWMLNSSWPSLIWQLYDYYNLPNGAFFGSKKACEPLHLQFAYDDNAVYLANQTFKDLDDLKVRAVLYNKDLDIKFSRGMDIESIGKYNSKYLFEIPAESFAEELSFLFLYLEDGDGLISKNVYFFPAGNDIYEEDRDEDWFYRPVKEFGSLRELREIPEAELNFEYNFSRKANHMEIYLELENKSRIISCFNQIKIYNQNNEVVAPVYWSDNYISLLPGEKEVIKGIIKEKEVKSIDGLQVMVERF
ncbi:glycoside hydrolase family 2 protein [Natronospora cellulosivora (SeqCode)]